MLQANESEKIVTIVILDDELPEPSEIVLVYLTNVTGGARVARGTLDGGILVSCGLTLTLIQVMGPFWCEVALLQMMELSFG